MKVTTLQQKLVYPTLKTIIVLCLVAHIGDSMQWCHTLWAQPATFDVLAHHTTAMEGCARVLGEVVFLFGLHAHP